MGTRLAGVLGVEEETRAGAGERLRSEAEGVTGTGEDDPN